jgi:hypothetical protein
MKLSESTQLKISLLVNVISLFLVILISIKKPDEKVRLVIDPNLEKKIEIIEDVNKQLNNEIDKLYNKLDTLEHAKPKIEYIYREKIKFISSANSMQLDSIIRSNW